MRLVLVLCLLALPAAAQWNTLPQNDNVLSDRTGQQAQPKLQAISTGGAYASWFDNATGGFDVYLQRVNANGSPQWNDNGNEIADRGFSSTQDYGLSIDTAGNALLVFRDDRPTGTQITATQVSSTGIQNWGSSGVQLTSTTDFVAAPKIAGTSDGNVVVAWTQGSDVRLQKLDSSGSPLWGAGVTLSPTTGAFSASDLQASDSGSVILAMTLETGGFGAPRHLYAQKLDSSGNLLWGASHVVVFDGGSLQFGNFPTFVTDGSGGAVFGWYETGPLECRAQRILSTGAEAFAHNGTIASTNAGQLRVSPAVAFDTATSDTYLFYQELNGSQSMTGISAQKFNSSGTRQWTDSGLTVVAMSSTSRTFVQCSWSAGVATGAWLESGQVHATGVDSSGTGVFSTFACSSTVSGRGRLSAELSSTGSTMLIWEDDRFGDDDILATNLLTDGSLGCPDVQATSAVRLGSGANPAGYTEVTPAIVGTSWQTSVDVATPGHLASVVSISLGGPLGGIPISFGELLCAPPLLNTTTLGGSHSIPIPDDCSLVGATFCTQAASIDLGPLVIQLNNAIDITVGTF